LANHDYARAVNEHYGRSHLGAAILEALRAAGKDIGALTAEDLAPVDHFHSRGLDATRELARLAMLEQGMHVLDVGGGIGGAARILASELGCQVTVLDLTEEYCSVGRELTRRVGLADRIRFEHGSAVDLPFPAAAFDAVWTQHSSMNIEDKHRLYGEICRVLRLGGRLALHEIVAGARSPIHFPVPWAREVSMSFLSPPSTIRTILAELGFAERAWVDVSIPSLEWFRRRLAATRGAAALPPLGVHLLLGSAFGTMFENQVRNLEESRIAVIQALFERRGGASGDAEQQGAEAGRRRRM
jgi:SAM-dependent methyltransferase